MSFVLIDANISIPSKYITSLSTSAQSITHESRAQSSSTVFVYSSITSCLKINLTFIPVSEHDMF